ncbi:MAG TPA: cytidine deaminase [Patescibacteria group bacterium]|nr:cytidine deaminase [Gammaproteobacteria bacterium]HWA51471.1 cytidine deaminase [Patescibacteria group bacterium]
MSDTTQILLNHAKAVIQNAYAPYSHFQVAAVIRTDTEQYFSGCNVENAAYGLTQCAEANAIGTMVAGGERHIQEILILSPTDNLCTPCGACRQLIYEFATEHTMIHLATTQGIQLSAPLREFLPYPFHLTDTSKK